MNVGQLKQIIAGLPDDAEVFARDRDCICLDQTHVVGHPAAPATPIAGERYVSRMDEVYGGDGEHYAPIKSAIIFCDCD